MRNAIARTLVRVLERLLPARGVHAASPEPAEIRANPWARPWTTPLPAHVIERHTPLRGEDIRLVRPYAPLDETLRLCVSALPRRPRRRLHYAPRGVPISVPAGATA
jgi:hypothetical protein